MHDLTSLLVPIDVTETVISLEPVTRHDLSALSVSDQAWVKAIGFTATEADICPIPDADNSISKVLVGVNSNASSPDPSWFAAICEKLGAGTYQFADHIDENTLAAGALSWCLAHYTFDRYLHDPAPIAVRKLVLPKTINSAAIVEEAETIALVRNLINTPTEDLGPADLQDTVEHLAKEHDAKCITVVGDDLLDKNFPAIHAVGRAAAQGREPRLIDMQWGDESHPHVTLVGKGVCYDTGGLDIKPGTGMRLMKKDMGGAAHAIGLARMIMTNKLKVKLRLLIPTIENAIAGNSYRPGDIISTRKGLSVEVGNTDAEGRIILCDALTLACEEKADLLFDFATLTGAARVALGPDLPATYANNETVWDALNTAAQNTNDPLWRMPLWEPYDKNLSSSVADVCNITDNGFAGSITAALYLQRFIANDVKWAHFDIFAWAPNAKPAQPKGAAVQAIRAAFDAIRTLVVS